MGHTASHTQKDDAPVTSEANHISPFCAQLKNELRYTPHPFSPIPYGVVPRKAHGIVYLLRYHECIQREERICMLTWLVRKILQV